ncbi:MAG: hypothetical protein QXJ64_05975 [Thermosphaera sp.]
MRLAVYVFIAAAAVLAGVCAKLYLDYGVQLLYGFISVDVIASSRFLCISLGSASPLEAFGATPGAPHLGCLRNRFTHAITSLSPVDPHLVHLSTLPLLFLSLLPHFGQVDGVFIGLT